MSNLLARKKLRVSGVVQGVGFRPFVYRLANKHKLSGHVLNTSSNVELEIEGTPEALEAFLHDLTTETPALADLRELITEDTLPLGEQQFCHSREFRFGSHGGAHSRGCGYLPRLPVRN